MSYVKNAFQEANPTEVLAMAAAYRHALLNHLQVVSGWLQMGQPNRVEEYIRELRDAMASETMLSKVADPAVAASFLLKKGFAENFGIELGFKVAPQVEGFSWPSEASFVVDKMADAAIMLVHRVPSGQRVMFALGGDEETWQLELQMHFKAPSDVAKEEDLLSMIKSMLSVQDWDAAIEAFMNAKGMITYREDGGDCPMGVVQLTWPRS